MRVALVHDWLLVNGGAEKVTSELLRIYDADVFSLVDLLNDEDRQEILHGKHARTTFIQRLPGVRKHYRNFLPFFPKAIESLDLSGYDLIISSSYAVAKGVRKGHHQVHVCYIHTPMRYAWVHEAMYIEDHKLSGIKASIVRTVLDRLRRWDHANSAFVDHFIANSRNVADRVRRIYGRTADVVLPPVDGDVFSLGEGPRSHYLVASRLVPYKKVHQIMRAFALMPERRLIVCGDGPEMEHLRTLLTPNITMVGHATRAELVQLMRTAKALIVAADEDLGLTPLEAQACGTPVIALRKGGYLETVSEPDRGVFFETPEPADIAAAVERFERSTSILPPAAIRERVSSYFAPAFRARIKAIVDAELVKHGRR
ncbi:MAG: glycosyltransferase [Flavobacteriales bacterium]|nr:glycosyltransferase [Flavobacteriales bacterium]